MGNAWKRSRDGIGARGARHEGTRHVHKICAVGARHESSGAHAVDEHGQGRRNTQSKRVGAWLAASGHMGTRQGPSMNKHSKEVRNVAHANTDTAH